jgi:hypothetical protein
MSAMIMQYTPNRASARYSAAGTGWVLIASDGTAHATYAALQAAGKVPFPGLDAGMFLQTLQLRSENASGADGSPFYYRVGSTTAPADDHEAMLCSGSGQVHTVPCPVRLLWLKKTVSGDEIIIEGRY